MDQIKEKCPVFEGGKKCPYNVPALKGLAAGCPEFTNGCPFKGVKDVGEFREKMGQMKSKNINTPNIDKAWQVYDPELY